MPGQVVTSYAMGSGAATRLSTDIAHKTTGKKPRLVFVFASPGTPLGLVLPQVVRAAPGAVVIGASTAGELTERHSGKGGVSALALCGDYKIFAGMGRGLAMSPEHAVQQALSSIPADVPDYPYRTAVLLLDPLAGNGEQATMIAGTMLGEEVRIVGGAAGDDLRMERTFVGLGEGVATDAIVVAVVFSRVPLGIGVAHGHRAITCGHTVTRAEGAVVHELDGEPAWRVWLSATRAHAAARGINVDRLSPDEETPFLLQYEAGLDTGVAMKIRGPLARTAEGAIQFATAIPEGTVLCITEGSAHAQVESAREAARRARAQIGGKPAGAVVFDCICRHLVLGDRFGEAVKGIGDELGGVPLAGFETYGEIALDTGDLSGFHNTTTVVLVFPEAADA